MIKNPKTFCFFDDGLFDYDEEIKKFSPDPYQILSESPMNKILHEHIIAVSVTDTFMGYDSAQITLDNEGGKFTSKMFDNAIRRVALFGDDLDVKETEGQFLAEGLAVSIYMGYYSGNNFSKLRLRLKGQISHMSFSYNSQGTPNISILVTDRFTFMGNPRLKNSDLTMMLEGEKGEPLPLEQFYMSNATKESVELALNISKGIKTKGGDRRNPLLQADRTSENLRWSEKKGRTNTTEKTKVYGSNKQLIETVGLRDSQVVAKVMKRYNKKAKALFGDEYTIKKCFIAMTGEGGNTYSTMTCYDPRVRTNKATQKLSIGYSDYLQYLAGRHNFDIFVKDRCLFFMPPIIKPVPDFVYVYGNPQNAEDINFDGKLISFTPKLNILKIGVDYYAMEYDEENGMVNYIRSSIAETKGEDYINNVTTHLYRMQNFAGDKPLGDPKDIRVIPSKDVRQDVYDQSGGSLIINSIYNSAIEEFIKSITQTEADILEAEVTLEGNPEIMAGMTIQIIGMSGDAEAGQRFDGNYRIEEITHDWTANGYTMRMKCKTRAIQGITAIDRQAMLKNNQEGKNGFIGLWKSKFFLEPSLFWDRVASEDPKIHPSLRHHLSSDDYDALINNGLPNKNILSKHTHDEDVEEFVLIDSDIPMVSYEEALSILYGKPIEQPWELTEEGISSSNVIV